jgi:hypothetical protein
MVALRKKRKAESVSSEDTDDDGKGHHGNGRPLRRHAHGGNPSAQSHPSGEGAERRQPTRAGPKRKRRRRKNQKSDERVIYGPFKITKPDASQTPPGYKRLRGPRKTNMPPLPEISTGLHGVQPVSPSPGSESVTAVSNSAKGGLEMSSTRVPSPHDTRKNHVERQETPEENFYRLSGTPEVRHCSPSQELTIPDTPVRSRSRCVQIQDSEGTGEDDLVEDDLVEDDLVEDDLVVALLQRSANKVTLSDEVTRKRAASDGGECRKSNAGLDWGPQILGKRAMSAEQRHERKHSPEL